MSSRIGWLKGLLFVVFLGVVSLFLGRFIPYLSSATLAVVIGLLVRNVWKTAPKWVLNGGGVAEKQLLPTGVVLIAFGLNPAVFVNLHWSTWAFIGSSVFVVLLVGFVISQWFLLPKSMGLLLGAGSAICGSAAIGAIAPFMSSNKSVGVAVGIINLVSTVALFVLPAMVVPLEMSDFNSAFIIGGIIQSMGHVVGAGYAVSSSVGELATVIKMGRVVFIVPVLLFLYVMTRFRKNQPNASSPAFPWFVVFFILAAMSSYFSMTPTTWTPFLERIGNFILLVALVGIGFSIDLKSVYKVAGKSMIVGFLIFAVQIALFIGYIFAINMT